jgi:hypothetical protein
LEDFSAFTHNGGFRSQYGKRSGTGTMQTKKMARRKNRRACTLFLNPRERYLIIAALSMKPLILTMSSVG